MSPRFMLLGEDEQESRESAQHEANQLDHAELIFGYFINLFVNFCRLQFRY